MIEINAPQGYITGLKYNRDGQNLTIPVKSQSLTNNSDEDNIGQIIETYRKLLKNDQLDRANEHWQQKRDRLENFISNINLESSVEAPTYIQLISTSDQNRNSLLELFKNNIIENYEHLNQRTFTKNFQKTDPNQSITEMTDSFEEKLTQFNYSKPDSIDFPLSKFWIIDDTISKGTTMEILIYKLIELGGIDENTDIEMFIIYNNDNIDKFKNFNLRDLSTV